MPFLDVGRQCLFVAKVSGDSSGKHKLILIHGAGGNHLHWPQSLRRLPGWDVLAPDLPGHGRSGGQAATSLNFYADTIEGLVTQLQLDRVSLLGHSMGGAIGLELALRRPGWLSKLIVFGCGPRLLVPGDLMILLQQACSSEEARRQSLNIISRRLYGFNADAATQARAAALLAEVPPETLYRDYLASNRFDAGTRLGRIAVPVLVVAGTDDLMTPIESCRRLAQGIRTAALAEVKNGGHMFFFDQASQVTGLVSDYLAD